MGNIIGILVVAISIGIVLEEMFVVVSVCHVLTITGYGMLVMCIIRAPSDAVGMIVRYIIDIVTDEHLIYSYIAIEGSNTDSINSAGLPTVVMLFLELIVPFLIYADPNIILSISRISLKIERLTQIVVVVSALNKRVNRCILRGVSLGQM